MPVPYLHPVFPNNAVRSDLIRSIPVQSMHKKSVLLFMLHVPRVEHQGGNGTASRLLWLRTVDVYLLILIPFPPWFVPSAATMIYSSSRINFVIFPTAMVWPWSLKVKRPSWG